MMVVATVPVLWTGSASAALFLLFSTTRAATGTLVTVRTAGEGALPNVPAGSPPLRVFLAPADAADDIRSPNDRRLVLLGRLRLDGDGNGSLQFAVPDIPAGEYTTISHCVPCAPFSAGRELVPTGPVPNPFVVLGSENPDTVPVSPDRDKVPVLPVALAAGAGLLLGFGLGWTLRRRPLIQRRR